MSDKCPQNFVQVVGQMSVSDKCPCRTNVRLPVTDCQLKEVVRMVKEPWDPDTRSINVATDSTAGSGEQVYVQFYDNDGNWAGSVRIYFDTQIQYTLAGCTSYNLFPVTLPPAPQKTWTITYNTAELRVVLHCNGVQVLNVLISDSVCTGNSDWRDLWEKEPTQIQFYSGDTASDNYCFSGNAGKYNEEFWEWNTLTGKI